MPFQSDKQKRWMYANEPEIAREWSDRYGAANGGIMDWAAQGGMKNYLGEQEMVNAPKHWQSRPDKPPTELAYITEPEKDLIMQADIHGSLSPNVRGFYGPNEGPSGLMSLDYQGDKGTYGQAGQSYGDREKPGGNVSVTTGNIHDAPQTVTRRTKTVSPKDHFTHSWTGPSNFFGGGGYRELKVPGDTSQGHKSRFNPLSMMLGFINPALGMAVRGFQGLKKYGPKIKKGFKEFGEHDTLMSYFNRNKKPTDMSQFASLGLYDDRVKQRALDEEALLSDNYSDRKISEESFSPVNVPASEYEGMFPFQAYEEFAPDNQGIRSIDTIANQYPPDIHLGNYDDIAGHSAKVIGPALFQMRTLEKKDAMSEYGGPKLTPAEKLKLNELKEMDADPDKVYNKILIG